MSKVKIKTLSPIHIGSGNLLQNNTDFVVEGRGDNSYIHIVDERKILELIGVEHIDNWLLSIEKRESTKEFIKRYAPSSSATDYTLHKISNYVSNIRPNDTLKEIIRNGLGLPYIPGSSIKGAIRTAVLASLSAGVKNREQKIYIRQSDGNFRTDRNGNRLVSAETVEKELFGSDPTSDIFRFIRIGDAYFGKDSLIATRMININIKDGKDVLEDASKPQLIEAISAEQETSLELQIADKYYDWVKQNYTLLGNMPVELRSVGTLFMLINNHSQSLLESEIKYWKNIGFTKSGAEGYIEELEYLLEEAKFCKKGKSCVLRVGHGAGWRFITGAWTEGLNNFAANVVTMARPNNQRYQSYDFPKSRRIDEDSEILGFVKLSIE